VSFDAEGICLRQSERMEITQSGYRLVSASGWYKYKDIYVNVLRQIRAEQGKSIQQKHLALNNDIQHPTTTSNKVSQQSSRLDPITHKTMSNRQAQIQREETRLQRGIFSPAEPISGLSLWWYDKTDFSNQPDVKARSEAVVRNNAPLRATEAWIR
jgi:hypothetical protein